MKILQCKVEILRSIIGGKDMGRLLGNKDGKKKMEGNPEGCGTAMMKDLEALVLKVEIV